LAPTTPGEARYLRALSGPAIVALIQSSSRSRALLTGGIQVNAHHVRSPMATYLSLFNWTDQGIRTVKDSPKRLEAARKALKKLGGELKAFYLLQGHYDGVLIFDIPDDEALTKFLLTTGSAGNVRTTTLRAFTEGEYMKHIAAL
jgi:uncharacterized protein with GYD domain